MMRRTMNKKGSHGREGGFRAQSSFELLITLSLGLAILFPLVIIAFIQLANANVSVSSIQAQQSASKLASIATVVGAEGPPAKQFVQLQVPSDIEDIYLGNQTNGVGHLLIFVVRAANGPTYITQYLPINVSGNLGGIVSQGTYLINVSYQANCPTKQSLPCVYMVPVI